MQHGHVTKFVLHSPVFFEYVESSAEPTFGVPHFDDKILASCLAIYAVLLLNLSLAYLSNMAMPKVEFACRRFYPAAYRCVQALYALFRAFKYLSNDVREGRVHSVASFRGPAHTYTYNSCIQPISKQHKAVCL